jgi:hypothetical protein
VRDESEEAEDIGQRAEGKRVFGFWLLVVRRS